MIRRTIALIVLALLTPALPVADAAESRTELAAVNGFERLIRLEPGDEGEDVARLQQALTNAGFFHFEVDGVYGPTTSSAVVAFHKYLDLDRSKAFNALDWIRLEMLPDPGLPERHDETDYVEVDLRRQLLFLIRDGELVQTIPVSTGSGSAYFSVRSGRTVTAATPQGDFVLKWHQTTWVCDQTTGWCVYKYWAFTDFYGIHGYRSVPTVPASHGCVRVEVWDADWLESRLFVGMPVHIWREPPRIDPPPAAPIAAEPRSGLL